MSRSTAAVPMRLLIVIIVCLVLFPSLAHAQGAIVLSDDRRAAGLTTTAVVDGLDFPMGMVELPDGSLLVATSPSDSGNFYASTGAIVRLFDSDYDGSLDDRRVV